jgi:transposase, IS5 family
MEQAALDLNLCVKVTRKARFLAEMEQVVPWSALIGLIEPHYRKGHLGRTPFPLATMLRIHFLQQWFGLSDPAMEEALFDVPLYRQFAQLPTGTPRLPDESTILRFRRRLEDKKLAERILATVNELLAARGLMLKTGTLVDATLIAAPSSTKNASGTRDPEMHQTKKGNQWHYGMKAHIGADQDSGLVHTVIGTAANVADVTVAQQLLHGQERVALGDAGYQGVERRAEAAGQTTEWHTAMRPSERKRWRRQRGIGKFIEQAERVKASVRAKVEHPFRVLKRQFGYTKVRYRGLAKNVAQLRTLFALGNLWLARGRLLATTG